MLFLQKKIDIDVELFENKKNNIDYALDMFQSVNSAPLDMFSSIVRKYIT